MIREDDSALPLGLNTYQKGLSKLEYFAAIAMQGILANPEILRNYPELDIHKAAIVNAQALIKELNNLQNDNQREKQLHSRE